jgi:hypothetical protein
MEITGKVDQIIVKSGKQHDVRFAFNMSDEDVAQLLAWRHAHLVITMVPLIEQLGFPESDEDLGQYMVDGQLFPIQEDRQHITGHELREIAELELVAPLWLVVVDKGQPDQDGFAEVTTTYEVIEPTAVIDLEDGMRFVSVLGESEEEPEEGPEPDDRELAAAVAADQVAVSPNGRGHSGAE